MPDLDVSAAIKEALACYRAGDLVRAEQIYRAIVAADPDAVHYADLAIVLETQGKYDAAVATYQEAMRRNPREARPHYNLGNLLRDRGRIDEAIACFQQALTLNPQYADAHNNLGRLLMSRGRSQEALAHFRKAIAAAPGFAHAHNNLGTALHAAGRLGEAIRCYRRAIELKADYAEAYSNLGSAHLRLDQLEAAIENCRKAASINPAFPDVHYNLANACRSALLMAEAIEHYERAISLRPDHGGYHWNYSMALLLAGDYPKGWREYEWRWQGCLELKSGKPAFSAPEWRGEDISGLTILLYREQGLGDVIQFMRYAPLVAARGARVVMACQPELVRLVGTVDGISAAVSIQQPLPRFDVHCPLLSLPLIFNTTLATIPSHAPYVRADGSRAEAWRKRIRPDAAFKVGLIWGGWAGNQIDARRSIPLADFAPLARLPGVTFYSLQKGQHAAQSPPAGMSLIDWSGELTDFADTAALVDNLDLVISVDTAGAHLAGAMGKRVWLLNRFESEWRWLLDREDSPWYPTMRIFRQPRPGDWASVMNEVRRALLAVAHKEKRCPVCSSSSVPHDAVDFNKSCEELHGEYLPASGTSILYYRCTNCGFCFAPDIAEWTLAEFEERIYNKDYVLVDPEYADARPRSNADGLKRMFGDSGTFLKHLDYGAGSGLLSSLLNLEGWQSKAYDPFVNRDMRIDQIGTFDLITAFEVFEHVPEPRKLMNELSQLLAANGIILLSTLLSDEQVIANQRLSWWYAAPRNGHISLFSRSSLASLAHDYGFRLRSFSNVIHCMWRRVPPWASHIFSVAPESGSNR